MRQGVNITHGCKVDWRGCGCNAALPAPGWLLQHRAGRGLSLGWLWVTVWQRQGWMVLAWSLLPFQGVLFGFSYLLAIFHSPLPSAALSGTNGVWKGKGRQWSLQHSCIWVLTPLVQGYAHTASITTALREEKSGVRNPHVQLRKGLVR